MRRSFQYSILAAFFAVFALFAISEDELNKAINEAKALLGKRQYAAVIEKLEPLKEDMAAIPDGVGTLAEAYYYNKDFEKAEEMFKQLLEISAEETHRKVALSSLASIYIGQKEYAKAIPILEELYGYEPENAELAYKIGLLYEFEKNYRKSIEHFKASYEKDPKNVKAIRHIVQIHLAQNDEDRAIDALDWAIRVTTDNQEVNDLYRSMLIKRNYRLGVQFFKSERYDDAIPHFKKILELDPGNTEVSLRLANAYFNNNQINSALIVLDEQSAKESVMESPENAFFIYKLYTLTYYRKEEYQRTVETGLKALVYKEYDFELNKYIGRSYEMLLNPSKALFYYERALSVNNSAHQVAHWSAIIHAKAYRYKEAMDILKKAIAYGYTDDEAQKLYDDVTIAYYLHLANRLYNDARTTIENAEAGRDAEALESVRSKLDEAIRYYSRALRIDRRPIVLVNTGNAYMLMNEYEKAEIVFKEAIEKDKNYINAYIALSRVYTKIGDSENNALIMEQLKAVENSSDPRTVYQIARNYEDAGYYDEAEARYRTIEGDRSYGKRAKERLARVLYNKGVLAYNVDNYDEAEKLFKEALRYEEGYDEPQIALKRIERERGRSELQRRIEKADAFYDEGEYGKAITEYQLVLEKNDDLTNVKINLANTFYQVQEYVNVISTVQPLYSEENKNKIVVLLMARSYSKLNDYENAKRFFLEAIEIDHDDYKTHTLLGTLYRDNGEEKLAIRSYKTAKDIASRTDAEYFEPQIFLGNLYYRAGDYDKALTEYAEVLEKQPDQPFANFNTSYIYYKKNNLEKALEYIEKAESLKGVPAYQLNLTKIYFYMDRYAEALETIEAAYEQMQYSSEHRSIAYMWWYAKVLAKVYKVEEDEAMKEKALTYLDKCIKNRASSRVAYLAKVERLSIDPKPVHVFNNSENVNVNALPAIYEDKQFVLTTDNEIVCQNIETEVDIWRKTEITPLHGPLIVGNYLYYSLDNRTLIARDLVTGDKVWEVENYSTAHYTPAGETLVCVSDEQMGEVVAYSNGKLLWTAGTPANTNSANLFVYEKTVYIQDKEGVRAVRLSDGTTLFDIANPEGYTTRHAIRMRNDIVLFNENWNSTYLTVHDVKNGGKKGEIEGISGKLVSDVDPIYGGKNVTLYTDRRKLLTVSVSSMKTIWEANVGEIVSLAFQGTDILVATRQNKLKSISVLNGSVIWEYDLDYETDNTFVTIYLKN